MAWRTPLTFAFDRKGYPAQGKLVWPGGVRPTVAEVTPLLEEK